MYNPLWHSGLPNLQCCSSGITIHALFVGNWCRIGGTEARITCGDETRQALFAHLWWAATRVMVHVPQHRVTLSFSYYKTGPIRSHFLWIAALHPALNPSYPYAVLRHPTYHVYSQGCPSRFKACFAFKSYNLLLRNTLSTLNILYHCLILLSSTYVKYSLQSINNLITKSIPIPLPQKNALNTFRDIVPNLSQYKYLLV